MTSSLKSLSLLALLAAAPLHAQEAAAPAEGAPVAAATPAPAEGATPAAPADAAPADAAPAAPAGEPAAEGATQVGQLYEKAREGDWIIRCLRSESGEDPCDLYQLLMDADGNAVAEISIRPLEGGGEAAAGANIVAPLETLLPEGLTLSVDGANTRRYPFMFCNQGGCAARVGLTAAEVEQLRRGNAGQLVLVPAAAPDQTVNLTISLTGFTAGYEAVAATPPMDAP